MTDISGDAAFRAGSGFRIGDVFERAFSIFSRNFVLFVALSAIATLPYVFIFWTQPQLMTPTPGAPPQTPQVGPILIPIFVGAALQLLSYAVIMNGAFQDMRGRKPQIGESLRSGFGRILPILGIAICYEIGITVGLILLIVPGLIWAVAWSLAVPVCVLEKLGPIKSLGRSARLTKGHRWKLFGLGLLFFIGSAIVGGILAVVGSAVGGLIGSVLVRYVWQAVYVAFGSILAAVIYHDLRVAKDGVDTDQIAAVFD